MQEQDFIPFPMDLKFGETPTTEFYNSENSIKVHMMSHPEGNFRERCFDMIMSTWQDGVGEYQIPKTEDNINKTFRKLLAFKVLPNSMEHLHFQFRLEGLTLVEITHVLRHRMFNSIHAQCTADRFLTHDSAFIPSSIEGTEFEEEYIRLTKETKRLYQDMVNSRKISIMDARYILPRNHRYFYYVGMNLKDAIMFIKQRRCTAIQPELDNLLAKGIYDSITSVIPELRDFLSLQCDPGCHTTFGNDEHTTRLYQPDNNHRELLERKLPEGMAINPDNFIYDKKRSEMGNFYNPGDK